MLKLGAAILFCLCLPFGAQAAIAPFAGFGLGPGAGALRELAKARGVSVDPGPDLYGQFGFIFPISPTKPHAFELQMSLGYLFQTREHDKEDRIALHRIPIEAMYFYRNTISGLRLGWGFTYHFGNEVEAKGKYSAAKTKFENSTGFILAAEKIFESTPGIMSWGLGLRYLMINYRSDQLPRDIDGNSVQFFISAYGF